jgi:hypothetical protein
LDEEANQLSLMGVSDHNDSEMMMDVDIDVDAHDFLTETVTETDARAGAGAGAGAGGEGMIAKESLLLKGKTKRTSTAPVGLGWDVYEYIAHRASLQDIGARGPAGAGGIEGLPDGISPRRLSSDMSARLATILGM